MHHTGSHVCFSSGDGSLTCRVLHPKEATDFSIDPVATNAKGNRATDCATDAGITQSVIIRLQKRIIKEWLLLLLLLNIDIIWPQFPTSTFQSTSFLKMTLGNAACCNYSSVNALTNNVERKNFVVCVFFNLVVSLLQTVLQWRAGVQINTIYQKPSSQGIIHQI